jgi:hypothetical protein
MTNIVTAKREIIQLGDIPLDVFQLPDASYRLSREGTASAVNKPRNNVLRFLNSSANLALPFKGLSDYTTKVEGERARINLVPFNLAIAYWTKEALAGNMQAVALLAACAQEALERRADAAFGAIKTEEERNEILASCWDEARYLTIMAHPAFCNAVKHKNHPGNLVHDFITKTILGDTAAEARLKPLIECDLDPTIGLNHQEDIINLGKVAKAKIKYSMLRKGTWQEQAQRACEAVM